MAVAVAVARVRVVARAREFSFLPFVCFLFVLFTLGVAIKVQQVFPPQRKIKTDKSKRERSLFSAESKTPIGQTVLLKKVFLR